MFKDIIPSYRIRVPTAAEMATKVSKEVHRLRAQEAALLRAYQVLKQALCRHLEARQRQRLFILRLVCVSFAERIRDSYRCSCHALPG